MGDGSRIECDKVIGVVTFGSVFVCAGVNCVEQITEAIEAHGGIVRDELNRKTDYLVIDPESEEARPQYEEAVEMRDLGEYPAVKIISVRWLCEFLGVEYTD